MIACPYLHIKTPADGVAFGRELKRQGISIDPYVPTEGHWSLDEDREVRWHGSPRIQVFTAPYVAAPTNSIPHFVSSIKQWKEHPL